MPSIVNQTPGSVESVSTLTITIPQPRAGNSLYALIAAQHVVGAVSGITGGGVTWANIAASNTNVRSELWRGYQSDGTGTSIATTFNNPTGNLRAVILEIEGLIYAGDGNASSNGVGTTATASGLTTTFGSDLIIATFAISDTPIVTGDGVYTQLTSPSVSTNPYLYGAYRVAGTTGAQSTTWTYSPSAGWDSIIHATKYQVPWIPETLPPPPMIYTGL